MTVKYDKMLPYSYLPHVNDTALSVCLSMCVSPLALSNARKDIASCYNRRVLEILACAVVLELTKVKEKLLALNTSLSWSRMPVPTDLWKGYNKPEHKETILEVFEDTTHNKTRAKILSAINIIVDDLYTCTDFVTLTPIFETYSRLVSNVNALCPVNELVDNCIGITNITLDEIKDELTRINSPIFPGVLASVLDVCELIKSGTLFMTAPTCSLEAANILYNLWARKQGITL